MSKTKKTPKTSNEIYTRIIKRILDSLERGDVPVWRKPFNPTRYGKRFQNPLSDIEYSGQNIWLLGWTMLIEEWDSPYFATFNQIKKNGGTIIKGSIGVQLVKYFPVKETRKEAAERFGIPVSQVNESARSIKFLRPSSFTVFNLKTQTENMDEFIPDDTLNIPEFETNESCETVWENYENKPPTLWDSELAAYHPTTDKIVMPPKSAFTNPDEVYATLFHEGVHSTGHKSRLNRPIQNNFGTKAYAIEELVAEIGASFLCGHSGIETQTLTENHTAYIASWLKRLQKDPDIIFKAIKFADKSVQYILGETVPEWTDDEIKEFKS